MHRYSNPTLWIGLCCFALMLSWSWAQPSVAPSRKTSPAESQTSEETDWIQGTADAGEYEQDGETEVFKLQGHVKLERPNGYLNADEVVTYRDIRDPERPVTTKTIATGHVDLKEGSLIATCEQAIFDEIKNTIQLKGSVVVIQNQDRVEAEEVLFDRSTNKRIFRGGVKFRVAVQTRQETDQEGGEASTGVSEAKDEERAAE